MRSKDGQPGVIRLLKVDRNIPPTLELIREKKTFYLGNQEPTGQILAAHLAECAMTSGAHRVELMSLADGWMAVSADADWITPNLQGRRDPFMESAFTGIIPLNGGLQNEMRFEVIVTAFSTDLSVRSGGRWITIVGVLPPPEARDRVAGKEFAVVFKAKLES